VTEERLKNILKRSRFGHLGFERSVVDRDASSGNRRATQFGGTTRRGGLSGSVVSNVLYALGGANSSGVVATNEAFTTPLYNICALYDQTKSVKSGSTVPIKLELCDSTGNDLSSSTIEVHGVDLKPLSSEPPGTLEASGNANPANDFRFDATLGASGGYIFNLSTQGLGTGTWGMDFTAGPTEEAHQVQFGVN
jgi:hypothetical protein